jgi:hypothetical protein
MLLGCGGSQGVQIAGIVTLDGSPLADGKIEFTPSPGVGGQAASAPIKDGRFEIPAARRLQPGQFRVEITAFRAVGVEKMMNPATGKEVDVEKFEPLIPARYNRESELKAELVARSPNQLSFALRSP